MTCLVKGCRFPHTHVTLGHICGSCGMFGHGQVECGHKDLCKNLIMKGLKDRVSDVCTVPGCIHPNLHLTSSHQCTTCKKYHGGECPREGQLKCPECKSSSSFRLPHPRLFLNKSECPVCLSEPINCILSPCGHGLCGDCASEMSGSKFWGEGRLYTEEKYKKLLIPKADLPPHLQAVAKEVLLPVARSGLKVASHHYAGMGCTMFIRITNNTIMGFFMHSDFHGQYGVGCPNTDHTPFRDRFLKDCICVSVEL